jgi:hypothetical protein
MKRLVIVFVLGLALVVATTPVSAQTPYRGTVVRLVGTSEPYFDTKLDPGQSYSGEFILQHEYEDAGKTLDLYIDASDFEYDIKTGNTIYPENSYKLDTSSSMVDWIKFDRQQVRLASYGQTETIKFTVTVPADAQPGTHYANILVSNTKREVITGKQPLVLDTQGAGIASRLVAATVLVTVNGKQNQTVTLQSVVVTSMDGEPGLFNFLHNNHPINITTAIDNRGNQVLLPGGNVFVHQGDKTKPVFSEELNPARARILPDTKREYTAVWNDSVISWKNGSLQLQLDRMPRLSWGRYFAEVNVLYRNTEGKITNQMQTVEFWVLPWKIMLLMALALVIFVAYRQYRRRKAKPVKTVIQTKDRGHLERLKSSQIKK